LNWQALASTRRDYVVSWRLADAQGHTVVQRDAEPASGYAPTTAWRPGDRVVDRYGMLVPTDLPPGPYALGIVVFDRASGAVCTFQHDGKAVPGTMLSLATVQVLGGPPAPTIEDPSPSHPAHATLGGLTLVGYDLDPGPYQPGDAIPLRLYWRVTGNVAGDDTVTARLVGDDGTAYDGSPSQLGPPGFPTSHWQRGRLVATYVDVPVPRQASTGAYQVSLTLAGDGSGRATLSDFPAVSIAARPRSFVAPPIPYPQAANFGGKIDLLGYDLQPSPSATAQPGQQISLTLYWRDTHPLGDDYKVFAHLVGTDGKIYGQDDSVPLDGQAPTTSWVPGEVLVDRYDLSVEPGAPRGSYRLVVGFYNPTTGARIPLAAHGGDSVVVASVNVAG